jgi:DivIVA domain-containing protein
LSLDRQDIEKKDFPIGRRGYEPEAVDAHLARVASELEAVQRQAQRRSGASLASAASEQVRAIVEAAETSAAEIERDAEAEAARIRDEAAAEAERRRKESVARSQEHVGKVHEATALMLQRVDAMESELGALIESLRTGANRLNADLSLLQGNMGELHGAAGSGAAPAAPAPPPPAPTPAPAAPAPPPAAPAPADDHELEADHAHAPEEPLEPAPLAEPDPAAPHQPPTHDRPPELAPSAAPAGTGDDVEGARLVALNMALNGDPREETDRYLAENFDLSDRAALLDEVYATVEG